MKIILLIAMSVVSSASFANGSKSLFTIKNEANLYYGYPNFERQLSDVWNEAVLRCLGNDQQVLIQGTHKSYTVYSNNGGHPLKYGVSATFICVDKL